MLTELRWQKERELMRGVFPGFIPFSRGGRFGFEGFLKGPHSGRVYGVTLEADHASYPQYPPRIAMSPRVGMHWIGDGERQRLCVEREWRPARSTFANTLLALVRYVDEHDPPPGAPPQDSAAEAQDAGGGFWSLGRSWRGDRGD